MKTTICSTFEVPCATKLGHWRQYRWTYLRNAGYLVAAFVCSLALMPRAHAQSLVWQNVAQLANGHNIVCQSADAHAVAECYMNAFGISPGLLQPRDFPSCGVAGNPIVGDCVWEWGYTPGSIWGTFETFVQQVAASPKDAGKTCQADSACGDPITMAIGDKVLIEPDYIAPGQNPLQFVRYYNSAPVASIAANFAPGWTHNYAMSINSISATSVLVTRSDGKAIVFKLSGAPGFRMLILTTHSCN